MKNVNPFNTAPTNLTTIKTAAKEMNRRRKFGPPELQFHASATLVAHGDPMSIKADERQDLAGEIAQFCVPVDRKWVGKMKRHHVDQVFEGLKADIMKRLREHGVLSAGE